MHFSKLRLSGFKSFVDPTEFRIEEGLTGIVGPNGCGKSNLLEALRWVMGANSAKALRGEGMDDVIFSGSADRPSRSHAEVTLTIDNADFDAPVDFNVAPVLEVSRRIDRGEGSLFRINGREVRARDIQLIFADASTGANSPALVRQGQISELIAAKPQNRRRILEEAAGVSGLHSRRHDVELRVRAADANMTRLDDVIGEVEATLGRARREAREAERYRRLAAEIRSLQAALLHARWAEATTAMATLQAEAVLADETVAGAAREAAGATIAAAQAEAAIRPARDEETAAAVILHKVTIDKERLDRALEAVAAEAGRLAVELERIDVDAAREAQLIEDAREALVRAEAEMARLEGEVAEGPGRLPALQAAAERSEEARAAADAEVEALAAAIAADQADARAHHLRVEELRVRLERAQAALNQTRVERLALGAVDDAGMADAEEALKRSQTRLDQARTALGALEDQLAEAARAEDEARTAARTAEDGLGRLVAEARGLAGAAAPPGGGYAPVIEALSLAAGMEAALAAALGDDLDAALDARADRYWGGRPASEPTWPAKVAPLSSKVTAPAALAARLAYIGLVDRADGAKLQASLPPGARIVSEQGDLWRWDGFTTRAEAPRPAQVRLEQKARLATIEGRIGALEPLVATARQRHLEMAAVLASAREAARGARVAPPAAEIDVARARDTVEKLARDHARRDSRAQSLDEAIARLRAEGDATAAALAAAEASRTAAPETSDRPERLAAARAGAQKARETAAAARAAFELEVHERARRQHRLTALVAERTDWSRRLMMARERLANLAAAKSGTSSALETARAAPTAIGAQRSRLAAELATVQAHHARSQAALGDREAARAEADRRSRSADAAAADARETRAALTGRLEGARERLVEFSAAAEAAGLPLEELERSLGQTVTAFKMDPRAMEERLATLERNREGLGAVNLRAEEEAGELSERLDGMRAERSDLAGALARLRQGLTELNAEGRGRLLSAFEVVNDHFRSLFTTLFEGGEAELRLVEADDPLEAGLEIYACPPGKRMAVMSLMSGGEQALTAVALIFAVFLANPAPVCFLDEVDAPLDDANVERFCDMLRSMGARASTRFIAITHNPLTMSRMDRLFGVTMPQRGVSQLVSVDLRQAEALAAQ